MSYDPYAYKPQASGTTAVMTQPGQSTTSYHPLHAPVPPPGNYVTPAAQSHHVDLRAQEVQLEQQQLQSVRPPIVAQKTRLARFSTVIGAVAFFWVMGVILALATGSGLFILFLPLLFSFVASIVLRLHIV
eukprot:gene26930-30448_t